MPGPLLVISKSTVNFPSRMLGFTEFHGHAAGTLGFCLSSTLADHPSKWQRFAYSEQTRHKCASVVISNSNAVTLEL